MCEIVTGTLTCHATTLASISKQIGFVPKYLEVWNPKTDVRLIWTKDMVDDTAQKISTVDGCLTDPLPAIGSTPANLATGLFNFRIAGVWYQKAAVSAGTAISATVIPQNKYGAFGLQIGTDGTFHALDAAANATGYATAALAKAAFEAVAVTASHVRVCCVVVMCSTGTFTGATDSLAGTGVTAIYYPYQSTYIRANGITPLNDNVTGQGFKVGLDTDLQVVGHTLFYSAWR